MRTVYFPNTYIDPAKAEWMASIWGAITLLQSSPETCLPDTHELHSSGVVEPIFPSTAIGKSLVEVLDDFKEWASQHAGGDLAAMMEQGQAAPFLYPQATSQIAADIRKGETTPANDPEQERLSRLVQACLFLTMAQEFDVQQMQLARQIEALNAREKEMLADLKGEEEAPEASLSFDDHAATGDGGGMVRLRVRAWSRVMADALKDPSTIDETADILYLTDSMEALSLIVEFFPQSALRWQSGQEADPSMPLDFGAVPEWLTDPLTRLSTILSSSATQRRPAITLFEIPELSALAFPIHILDRMQGSISSLRPHESHASCWVAGINWPSSRHDPTGGGVDSL